MILNKEHADAAQVEADLWRANYIKKLPESDQKKVLALEQASKLLKDAGVLFYLFGSVPYELNPKEHCMIQFNSITANSFKENEKFDFNLANELHQSFLYSVFSFYTQSSNDSDLDSQIQRFAYFIKSSVVNNKIRLFSPIKIKEIKANFDLHKFMEKFSSKNIYYIPEETLTELLQSYTNSFTFGIFQALVTKKYYWFMKDNVDESPNGRIGFMSDQSFATPEEAELQVNQIIEEMSQNETKL